MEILEQLRTQDPPHLAEVDPALPPELNAIVGRALHKDPTRRFAGLGQMRAELERVRHRLADDGTRLRSAVQTQLGELRQLQEGLAERCGGPWTEERLLAVDERARLRTLETVHRRATARIEALRGLWSLTESLQPDVDRGLNALRRNELEEAVSTFERVVRAMPEHARAAAGLEEARRRREAQRQRRDLLTSLVREATTALDARAYARCLDTLRHLEEVAAPGDLPAEAEALRRAAQRALAAEQEVAGHGESAQAPVGFDETVVAETLAVVVEAPPTKLSEVTATVLAQPPASLPETGVSAPSRTTPSRPAVAPTARTGPSEATVPVPVPSREAGRLPKRCDRLTAHARAWRPGRLALWSATGLVLALVAGWLYDSRPGPPPGPPLAILREVRSATLATRERVVRAEADVLAKDAFAAAQARVEEGDRLMAAPDLGAAAQAYRDAVERYAQAERQAETKREERAEADAARRRMLAEKPRAHPDASEFAAALTDEREGASRYERLAFKEAAASFHAAAEVFARAREKPEPPQPPVRDARAEIRAVLNRYVRAMETKDLVLLRAIRPGITDEELRRVRPPSRSSGVTGWT
jgi:hypothetical protein